MKLVRHLLVTTLLLSLLAAPARAQVSPRLTRPSVTDGGVSVKGPARLVPSVQSSGGTFTIEGAIGQSSGAATGGGTFSVQGAIGQPLAGESSGGTFTVQEGSLATPQAPFVQTIVRAGVSPAIQSSTVGYTVTFTAPVTGVDLADFQLTTAGLTGAAVTGVTGSGATYDVTVNTGTPASAGATLRLDVVDDDSIVDASNAAPLGGAGTGNGDFASGEVYTVNPNLARANDALVSEPSAGTASMLFSVTLSAPAPAGGVSVGYATASGGATPAAGGASCGGAVDYESAGGTLNFAVGEQVKTVSVNVCADTSGGESNETLLLNLSGATGANVQVAQATGTITQGPNAGTFVISELRTSGPGGSADDFVEFYNNTDAPLTVAASDGSAGYGVFKMGADCNAAPVLIATIPNGTTIPARGHYLAAGAGYTLADHGGTGAAAGDTTLTADLGNDRNVGVFSTANVANVSSANRLDAVGFGGSNAGAVCDLLREGGNLPSVSGSTTEHSHFRKQCGFVPVAGCTAGGNPKDTGDNSADFLFADTEGTPIAGVTQRLGAPGPENLTSPIRRDTSGVFATLLDSTKPSGVEPNRHRDLTNTGTNKTFGTLSIRRRVTNITGQPVTRLRFRIVELTTFPSPGGGQADLRALSSSAVSVMSMGDAGTCSPNPAPCTVTVEGTTLETPPAQPNGGGYNSTLSAGTVTLATPLAHNSAVNLQFLLGIETPGTFRFYIIVEALP
ncbi:MAG TPA: hypothetical protein VFZ44_11015 [Pyrinomonadaceae bacterium]